MKYLIILLLIATPVFAYEVPDSIVDAGVVASVEAIDKYTSELDDLNKQKLSRQEDIVLIQRRITEIDSEIVKLETKINEHKQSLTALASQNPAVQSALDLLNEKPEYGINWSVNP